MTIRVGRLVLQRGGNETYTGMNMHDAHTGMNINHEEFLEVLTDISKALQKNGVSQADHDAS